VDTIVARRWGEFQDSKLELFGCETKSADAESPSDATAPAASQVPV